MTQKWKTLIDYQDRMHKDALKARHLGMDLDLNKLQLKLDKAEIIEQLNDFSEEAVSYTHLTLPTISSV